jgi:photosystem II stability/assembly factor-like uncharacterized protein
VHAVPPPRVALVPNAIAFRDPSRGLLGTGSTACARASCPGTISLTTDGGRTWKVVLRTPRPVVSVSFPGTTAWARFDDGEHLRSDDSGRTWAPAPAPTPFSPPCPPNEFYDVEGTWALCTTQGGAGNMGKSVYRLATQWTLVADTPFGTHGHGGISVYGYPQGITGADDGFGMIWEFRGTLYVTRDGGSDWVGLPSVARPEVDFGLSGAVLRHGVGFVLLSRAPNVRLVVTRDAGRTWRVVHRWP